MKTILKLRTILPILAIALTHNACLSGSDGDDDGQNTNTGTHTQEITEVTAQRGNLLVTLSVDHARYEVGDPVHISFVVKNTGHSDEMLSFVTGQEHDIRIADDHGLVRNYSFGRFYTQALHNRTIRAGEELSFTWTWTQDRNGSQSFASPGHYEIEAYLTSSSTVRSGTLSIEIVE